MEAAQERISAMRRVLFIALAVAVIFVFLLNIALGSVNIALPEVVSIMRGKGATIATHESIIMKIRLPRAIAAATGGVCLALAGLLVQIFFANPIVEPYVLGISSGSTMFVSLVVLGGYFSGYSMETPLFMFFGSLAGAFIVMIAVVLASQKVQSVVTLLVIGMMAGYLCSSVRSILVAFADQESLRSFTMWTMGSFGGFTWEKVAILCSVTFVFSLLAFALSKPLNAMLLGEGYAQSMGLGIKQFRMAVVVIASVLTAVLTGFAGPISFVGLSVPHLARILFKTADNRVLIPAVVLGGALMTSLCDLAARTLFAPNELPIDAITALVGAPLMVYMLLRRNNAL
ncbi:MAG: iron ABC transporter permease [Eubacteriaceae bacterium]|nr:iron ABC transporter permease [Eubacteriaceae bacterium]